MRGNRPQTQSNIEETELLEEMYSELVKNCDKTCFQEELGPFDPFFLESMSEDFNSETSECGSSDS